jgi:hypothetical protein
MEESIIPRDRVAAELAVPVPVLIRYESRGLGINLAGLEAELKLRDHLEEVHERLHMLANDLRQAVEWRREGTPDDDA